MRPHAPFKCLGLGNKGENLGIEKVTEAFLVRNVPKNNVILHLSPISATLATVFVSSEKH